MAAKNATDPFFSNEELNRGTEFGKIQNLAFQSHNSASFYSILSLLKGYSQEKKKEQTHKKNFYVNSIKLFQSKRQANQEFEWFVGKQLSFS